MDEMASLDMVFFSVNSLQWRKVENTFLIAASNVASSKEDKGQMVATMWWRTSMVIGSTMLWLCSPKYFLMPCMSHCTCRPLHTSKGRSLSVCREWT